MPRRTRRTTLTLDADALKLAERAAALRGITLSALVSRAMRNEAVRIGAPAHPDGSEPEALHDEMEREAIEQAESGGEGRAA